MKKLDSLALQYELAQIKIEVARKFPESNQSAKNMKLQSEKLMEYCEVQREYLGKLQSVYIENNGYEKLLEDIELMQRKEKVFWELKKVNENEKNKEEQNGK